MEICDTLWPLGTFSIHLVHFSGFGIMYQEKSGNPDRKRYKGESVDEPQLRRTRIEDDLSRFPRIGRWFVTGAAGTSLDAVMDV
jgi:hypothetical protein